MSDLPRGQLHLAVWENAITTSVGTSMESVLRDCAALLQHLAAYQLPPAIDRRLLWLSENKETLTKAEREELLALVELAEERTVEKLRARAVLKQLAETWPHLAPTQS